MSKTEEENCPGDENPGNGSNQQQDSNMDRGRAKGPRFGQVPVELFALPGLKVPAKFLYAYLMTYVAPRDVWQVFPSQKRMARETVTPLSTIRRWLDELEAYGLLTREYRVKVEPGFKGNPGARIYTLYPPQILTAQERAVPHKQRGNAQQRAVGKPVDERSDSSPASKDHTKEHTKEHTKKDDHQSWKEKARNLLRGNHRTRIVEKKIAHTGHLIEEGREISDPIAYTERSVINAEDEIQRSRKLEDKPLPVDTDAEEHRRKYAEEFDV